MTAAAVLARSDQNGLTSPAALPDVTAVCAPPTGWKAEPLKASPRHNHQVWLSPTGRTAYGVIHFSLPFPVGVNLVHWQFLREMKRTEGDANDLGQEYDDRLPGLRFVAEGGLYKMRANLIVRGSEGWVVYAGTLRKEEVMPAELDLAERARETTSVGLPAQQSVQAD